MTRIDFLTAQCVGQLDGRQAIPDQVKQRVEVSFAGAELRRLQSSAQQGRRRVYTGRIGSGARRGYRGQTVVLPGQRLATLLGALRGWACVSWTDPFAIRSRRVDFVRADEIEPFRNPCAVTLGRLKRGRRERQSEAKARACRRNAHLPSRPGSRPRGRPGKQSGPSASEQPLDAIAVLEASA
jgi:hypothetical protein